MFASHVHTKAPNKRFDVLFLDGKSSLNWYMLIHAFLKIIVIKLMDHSLLIEFSCHNNVNYIKPCLHHMYTQKPQTEGSVFHFSSENSTENT